MPHLGETRQDRVSRKINKLKAEGKGNRQAVSQAINTINGTKKKR